MPSLNLTLGLDIAKRSGLIKPRVAIAVGLYQIGATMVATLDGVSLVLLVNLVTTGLNEQTANPIFEQIIDWLKSVGVSADFPIFLMVVVTALFAKMVLAACLDASDAKFTAYAREHIQRALFLTILATQWSVLQRLRIGQLAATFTDEAQTCTKYLLSTARLGSCLIGVMVISFLAITVNIEISLLLGAVGIPLMLILRAVFRWQTQLSSDQMLARQELAANVTERIGNLLQIKTSRSEHLHALAGLRLTKTIAKLEVRIGWALAFVNSFNILVVTVSLTVFSLWCAWRNMPLQEGFVSLASVGVLGTRAIGQINNALVAFGNLSRLSASLIPVNEILRFPKEIPRTLVTERITDVEMSGISFRSEGAARGIERIDLRVGPGSPIVIRGPSGSGKTTIANIICGLYQPDSGAVTYVGQSGKRYDSGQWAARISYVTQDVMLFQASVRDNILQGNTGVSDTDLWSLLEKVGAAEFVREHGGLDAILIEGGRSLSGGERRRLAIARALAACPDILIFDEIMSGLDSELKVAIGKLMNALSSSLVVIAISHDPDEAFGWQALELTI